TEPHGDHLGGVLEAAEEGGDGPNASHLAVRLPRRGFPADPRNDSRSEIPEHPGPAGPWSVHVTGLPGTCQKGWVVSFGMSWQRKLNKALVRFTGFQVNRVGNKGIAAASTAPAKAASTKAKAKQTEAEIGPPADPKTDRLLTEPIFIISPVRSGSTLLRSILNAHSDLHAPHELHVRRLRVEFGTSLAVKAMEALGHNQADLEHLL